MNNRQRKKSRPPVRIEPAAKNIDTKSVIMDMFANQLARTGMGGQNLMNATEYELTRITRNYQLLTTLYRENWIVKKIINTIPEDMCKNWIEITSQMSPEMIKRYEALEKRTKVKSKILTALYWSRLFGGSAAVMLISGQEDLSNPLDLESIMPGDFKGLMVLDRWMGIYPEPEIISDIDDPDYGLPEYYQIKDEATSTTVRIHHSRMLRFPGRELPIWEQMAEMYWGASELEHIFEEIAKRDNTSWNIASLIFKMSILAVNTEGMDALLSLGDIEAQREFYQTQQAINTMMNNNSMLLLGANDKMQQLQYTFTGVSDVYQNFMLDLSGASEIPATKLFGREPAGMNSTGESDMDNYNNLIENQQESKLRPPLEQLLPIMFMSEFGFVPEDLEFRFKPVQTPNESDIADLVSKKVGSIKDAYDSGLINQKIGMKELKALSDSTGMFTNITDEDIEMASTDFADESMMGSLGAGFGGLPGASLPPANPLNTAFDEDRWITIKKSEEGNGRKIKIDEKGNITGGSVPKSAQGKPIGSWWQGSNNANDPKASEPSPTMHKSIEKSNAIAVNAIAEAYERRRKELNLNLTPADQIKNTATMKVDLKGIDDHLASDTVDQFSELAKKYNTSCIRMESGIVGIMSSVPAETQVNAAAASSVITFNKAIMNNYDKFIDRVKGAVEKGWFPSIPESEYSKYAVTHEFAHTLMENSGKLKNYVGLDTSGIAKARKEIAKLYSDYKSESSEIESQFKAAEKKAMETLNQDDWNKAVGLSNKLKSVKVSRYANANADEFMSEAFVSAELSDKPSEYALKVQKILQDTFKAV
jgi:phage-related protein, HI1409 family